MPKASKLSEYRLAIGPSQNLYICVKGKPHLIYSLAAFEQLVKEGKIKP
jgi:hypothetical protein